MQYRINSKIVNPVLRCTHGLTPSYLEKLIITKKPRRQGLRSEDLNRQLEILRTSRHTFAARCFRVRGPTLWNQLPKHVKTIEDYSTFKKHLKTFHFKKVFT